VITVIVYEVTYSDIDNDDDDGGKYEDQCSGEEFL
jgi:hypothetical protein